MALFKKRISLSLSHKTIAQLFKPRDMIYALNHPVTRPYFSQIHCDTSPSVGPKYSKVLYGYHPGGRQSAPSHYFGHFFQRPSGDALVWYRGNQLEELRQRVLDSNEVITFLERHPAYSPKRSHDGVHERERITRVCKGVLEYQLRRGNQIHFLLDQMDVSAVIHKRGKDGTSITASELRKCYRLFLEEPEMVTNHLILYRNQTPISAAAFFSQPEWLDYQPGHHPNPEAGDWNLYQKSVGSTLSGEAKLDRFITPIRSDSVKSIALVDLLARASEPMTSSFLTLLVRGAFQIADPKVQSLTLKDLAFAQIERGDLTSVSHLLESIPEREIRQMAVEQAIEELKGCLTSENLGNLKTIGQLAALLEPDKQRFACSGLRDIVEPIIISLGKAGYGSRGAELFGYLDVLSPSEAELVKKQFCVALAQSGYRTYAWLNARRMSDTANGGIYKREALNKVWT